MKLYHYTVRHDTHLGGILRDGFIDIEGSKYGSGYYPWLPSAAWFSSRTDYEPTAVKGAVYKDGRMSRMAVGRYLSEAARIRIDTDKVPVIGWYGFTRHAVGKPLLTKANRALVVKSLKGLERIGRGWDGSPDDWLCSLTPVSLGKVEAIETYGDGQWVSVPFGRTQQVATG